VTDTPHPAAVLGRPGQAYEAARLRWATQADAERLQALWRAAYPDAAHDDAACAWLEHGGVLMLEDHRGTVLAALRYRHAADGWDIDRVATLPAHRGQGYGRWLMTRVEAAAIRANVPYLRLALPAHTSADQRSYYRRMGYVERDDVGESLVLHKRVGGTWQTKSPSAARWLRADA
jgi:GNAT superfamily N-acetyltransferase